MTRRALAVPVLALLLVPAAARAQVGGPAPEDYGLRFEYLDFRATLAGEVENGSGEVEGTALDLADDLGIGSEGIREFRASLQFKRGHKLRGSYTSIDFGGDVPGVDEAFQFGLTSFPRDTQVATSLKGTLYSAEYEWDLMRRSSGHLGLLLGARIADIDALIVAPDEGLREQDTLTAPVPVIGLTARIYRGRLSVQGEVCGLTIGKRGTLVDAVGAVRFHVSDRMAIGAGYRRLDLRGEDGPDVLDMVLDGWQFGVELSL